MCAIFGNCYPGISPMRPAAGDISESLRGYCLRVQRGFQGVYPGINFSYFILIINFLVWRLLCLDKEHIWKFCIHTGTVLETLFSCKAVNEWNNHKAPLSLKPHPRLLLNVPMQCHPVTFPTLHVLNAHMARGWRSKTKYLHIPSLPFLPCNQTPKTA